MNSNEHNPMDQWPGENISDSPNYDTNGKAKLVAIVALSTVAIIVALSYLYDRWHRRRSRNMVSLATNPSHTGLDPAVVKTFPVFTFSDATHKDQTDCAVCLSEFEEGESGRVLPGCKHAFHVECIDMWFHSHSTCPLCRSLVEPPPTTTVEEQVTIITIDNLGREPAAIETPRRSFSEFEDDLTRDLSFTRMSSCQIVMTESDIELGEKR
ncbi:hypothetical protein YC2023_005746 [Brassica napus]